MKYEIVIGFEWLPSWKPGASWAEMSGTKAARLSVAFPSVVGDKRAALAAEQRKGNRGENNAADCLSAPVRAPRVLRTAVGFPAPMTDALVRGAALAVMLLACSRVSDVQVRCPAVELMVLACWAFRGMQSVRPWWMSVVLQRPASLLLCQAVSFLSGRAQLALKSETA